MPSISLHTPLSALSRSGTTTVKKFKALGLENIQDLLFYFPWRYDDYRQTKKIADLEVGETINLVGTIELIQNKRSFKRRKYITEALISDDSGQLKVVWFNQAFLTKNLQAGEQISLAGKISEHYGQVAMIAPQYEKLRPTDLINTQGLVPVYSLSAGLHQKQLRYFIRQILPLADKVADWLPSDIRQDLKLLPLGQALKQIHFPQDYNEVNQARQRLEFAELFWRQLRGQMIKNKLKQKIAPVIKFQEDNTKKFVAALPFTLTADQKKSAWEIVQDLNKAQPMSRLLAGDVGSGKTVVAAIALLNVVKNQQQTALMAPTEILARQHYQTLQELFRAEGIKIALLTAGEKTANFSLPDKKKEQVAFILQQADIIIGTHALLYQHHPPKLALAIVDEQHRFGVAQRQYLSQLSSQKIAPHFLSLSATPIPRSLALAIYGDLDLSMIKQLPANRKKIITKLVADDKRSAAYDFIKEKITAGQQAFVVCPLIEESDKLGVKSVKAESERLQTEVFPEFSLGLLHGRLKSADKEKVMTDFLAGKIQILVSTSVIEVGIDVPNATIMMIEGAERFGLSQLHQFRGRVGRGDKQSYCLLFTTQENILEKTNQRLQALADHHDGLSLAKIDLSLRGGGDLYGRLQSGFIELKLASLFDYQLIKNARQAALKLLAKDPELKEHQLLKTALGDWEKNIHLE